jgi:hypothetical protein
MSVLAPLGLSCLAEDAEPVGCPAGTVLVEQGDSAASHVMLLVQVGLSSMLLLVQVVAKQCLCENGNTLPTE